MRFVWLFTAAALVASVCPAASVSHSSPSGVYSRVIQQLGGKVVNVSAYPATIAGFEAFLRDSGVSRISAAELTEPNHPEIAARYGFSNFLPPQSWWPRGAALAMVTQAIEGITSAAVHVRNWWRPTAYNNDKFVGGAKNGDHPTANAVDLDYASVMDRMKAEHYLRGLCNRFPWMRISLGLGAATTHVGIDSPHGHREWHYAGWTPAS